MVFLDESGISQKPSARRTWAPRGKSLFFTICSAWLPRAGRRTRSRSLVCASAPPSRTPRISPSLPENHARRGHGCSQRSTKLTPCAVPAVVPRCGSSPSSPNPCRNRLGHSCGLMSTISRTAGVGPWSPRRGAPRRVSNTFLPPRRGGFPHKGIRGCRLSVFALYSSAVSAMPTTWTYPAFVKTRASRSL